MDGIIIDLSSDKECEDEDDIDRVMNPSKKPKLDSVIVLTDEENDAGLQEDSGFPDRVNKYISIIVNKTETENSNTNNHAIVPVGAEKNNGVVPANILTALLQDSSNYQATNQLNEIPKQEDNEATVSTIKQEKTSSENKANSNESEVERDSDEPQDSLLKVIREEDFDHKDQVSPMEESESPETPESPLCASSVNSPQTLNLENDNCEITSHCSTNQPSEASCSKAKTELPIELEAFLKICKTNVQSTHIEAKLKSVRSAAKRASTYLTSKQFLDDLENFRNEILKEPKRTAHVFVQLYNKFKEKEDAHTEREEIGHKIDKLYRKLEAVQKVIDAQAAQEVNFELEENSSFMKYERYKERADKIVRHIRQLEHKDPYSGIAYFSRLDFTKSAYNDFNLALNKKYSNRHKHTFPQFFEVDKCLRKCAKEKGLNLSEGVLSTEVKFCFEELGKLLKKRRQKDLEFIHSTFVPNHEDPAKQDPELEKKLRENHKNARTKMDEVLKKFTVMQDTGVDPNLSEDSDDSKHQDTDDEDDDDA